MIPAFDLMKIELAIAGNDADVDEDGAVEFSLWLTPKLKIIRNAGLIYFC